MDSAHTADYTTTEVLAQVPLFWGFSREEAEVLRTLADVRRYRAGEAVIVEGQLGRPDFFIVMDGGVDVCGDGRRLLHLEKHASFGEVAFVANRKRSASVTASTDCVLLRFDADVVETLLDGNPRLAWKFMRSIAALICDRFLEMDRQVRKLLENAAPELKDGYSGAHAATMKMPPSNNRRSA